MIIAPSILSADFANMAAELAAVKTAGADWIHVDVMDGHFVPNLTFGPPIIKKYRPHSDLPFDVHLMVSNADDYIDDYADAGADHITVHVEAVDDPAATLKRIRKLGKKAGISVKPKTPASSIQPYLEHLDLILVMTVEPGFGGQSFMEDQMPKISEIRDMINGCDHEIYLAVDGGIAPTTIKTAANAGADTFIAGSAVFKGDYAENIQALRDAQQSS